MIVSDLVLTQPLAPDLRAGVDRFVGCVAGAAVREDYLREMRDAGFAAVEVLAESRYDPGLAALPEDSPERAAFDAVRSITVRARKE